MNMKLILNANCEIRVKLKLNATCGIRVKLKFVHIVKLLVA